MERKGRSSGEDAARKAPVFNPKGIGPNALLAAAAAIVPLFIVGVAGLTSLADRRKGKRPFRLPRR